MTIRQVEEQRRSLADPEGFWGEAAAAIDWERRWDCVLDRSRPPFFRWFRGARLNTCWNALDRHVAKGRGEQLALVYDSPVTGQVKRFTYRALRDDVAKLAGALQGLGVERGDRVIIYMPLVPEAVMAMLACARIGAIHSVVFGGFAAPELATRIDDAKPKVVLSASCGIEPGRTVAYKPLLDQAIERATEKPSATIILQRPTQPCALVPGRDYDWAETVAKAQPASCVTLEATDPLYILYTSGTTGQPKGIVRDNGGHAVALHWSMANVYGMKPGEVFFAASDVGWVVGHSYIVYAPLLYGCTTVLYEGKPVGTPDAGAYWRVIAEHGVDAMFTAPTAFRAIRRDDPDGHFIRKYDLSKFRTLFLAGERADPATGEQWGPGNVLGHMSDILPFWTGEIRRALGGAEWIGRGDDGYGVRRRAIDAGPSRDRDELRAAVVTGIDGVRALLDELRHEDLARAIEHRRAAGIEQKTIGQAVDDVLVRHLESHVRQLSEVL